MAQSVKHLPLTPVTIPACWDQAPHQAAHQAAHRAPCSAGSADPCHGLSRSHARDSTAGTPGVWRGFNSSAERTEQDRRAARTGTMLGNGQMHWVRAIRRGAIRGGGGDPAGRCTRELSKILGMFWNVMGVQGCPPSNLRDLWGGECSRT